MQERTVTLAIPDGLHARPATALVQLAKSFQSSVVLENAGRIANAKSPIKLMLLALKDGATVRVTTDGADDAPAADAIAAFLAGGWVETNSEDKAATG